MSISDARPVRVAIVGSTATGKSDVAMAVATELGDVDLVSVDSMQVYRGMDIGTAKPTPADQERVRHHCIDLVDRTSEFNVADFRAAASTAFDAIASAGRRALLVGGTGLYHRVVIDDFDLPGAFPAARTDIETTTDTAALHVRLAALDPVAAAKIDPGNRRRVVRALEVTVGAGRPFSSFGPGVGCYPATDVVQIGLRRSRGVVSERVERRVHAMVAAGLFDEVERLATGGFSRSAGQALGYKEILLHLDGGVGKDEAIEMIITRTRQFAVRQERWFARDPRVQWIDVDRDPVSAAVPTVIQALSA